MALFQLSAVRALGAVAAPETQQITFSVTKSFMGTLASILVAEGRLDPEKPVTHYVPELAKSGFAGATVRQVMDMTTGIAFDETYTNPHADIFRGGDPLRLCTAPENSRVPRFRVEKIYTAQRLR